MLIQAPGPCSSTDARDLPRVRAGQRTNPSLQGGLPGLRAAESPHCVDAVKQHQTLVALYLAGEAPAQHAGNQRARHDADADSSAWAGDHIALLADGRRRRWCGWRRRGGRGGGRGGGCWGARISFSGCPPTNPVAGISLVAVDDCVGAAVDTALLNTFLLLQGGRRGGGSALDRMQRGRRQRQRGAAAADDGAAEGAAEGDAAAEDEDEEEGEGGGRGKGKKGGKKKKAVNKESKQEMRDHRDQVREDKEEKDEKKREKYADREAEREARWAAKVRTSALWSCGCVPRSGFSLVASVLATCSCNGGVSFELF